MSRYKKENFNRIWNKESSKSRDKLMAKVKQRGLQPTEKNCFEYYMGYIRAWRDRRGNVSHLNSFYNKAYMKSIGNLWENYMKRIRTLDENQQKHI